MLYLNELIEIKEENDRYSHVDGYNVRKEFFNTIIARIGIDQSFDDLVDKQLSLFF